MSMEDDLAAAIMNRPEYDIINREYHLEEHYNHYGDRGVVDLVEEQWEGDGSKNNREIWIYELKADSAVQNATGANEIIRQFKRHREYFFAGSDFHRDDYYSVNYALCFYPTETTYRHVKSNESLYRTLLQGNPDPAETNAGSFTKIMFYHPDAEGYAHYFSDFWGADSNSRSILEILGREDEFVDFEDVLREKR